MMLRIRCTTFLAIALVAAACLAGCATVTREEALRFGSFEVIPGPANRHGVVLGAPHGTADTNTAQIAALLAKDLGVPVLIARGFTRLETGDRRINVNRPTEGVAADAGFNSELWTGRAGQVWQEYRRLLLDTAGQDLVLYIEIHSNNHPATGGAIEIATTGFSSEQARRIRDTYYRSRDQALAGTNAKRVELKIEPIEPVYMNGYGSKNHGAAKLARMSMQVEIPIPATSLALEKGPYRKVLAATLREAIAVLQDNR